MGDSGPGENNGNAEGSPEDRRRRTLGRAGLIGSATMTSRVLGLLREHVFAKLFGTGPWADAFIIAYRIPNLLRELFAEGALSAALVPTLADTRERDGSPEAFRVANVVLSALVLVIGVVTVLGLVLAPILVDLLARGFPPETRDLAVKLTRWLMPFLFLMSWAALCRGVLNSHHRFGIPALAPVIFNVVAVSTGYALWFSRSDPGPAIFTWSLAMLGGAAMAVVIQLPALWRMGLRFRPLFAFRHPGFRRIVRHMMPATLGLAAVQVNIVVNSTLALTVAGDISHLNYAFRMVFLPIGVIGVAVATVNTVSVSDAAARRDPGAFRGHLSDALRWVAFFALPAMAGLILLAEPIVRLIFEYGRFTTEDTARTAAALRGYGGGLVFMCGVKVMAPAFYALDRMRVPVLASLAAVATNLAWALSTYGSFGYVSLAIGTALAGLVNGGVLVLALARSPQGGFAPGFLGAVVRMTLLAGVIGAAAWGLHGALDHGLGHASLGSRAAAVGSAIAASIVLLVGGGRLLRLPEATDLSAMMRRQRRN